MATTVSYSASMRTRKTNSASNAKGSAASQEYYENTYNYVGIVHFAGMALSGKVITGITLRIVAAQAGYACVKQPIGSPCTARARPQQHGKIQTRLICRVAHFQHSAVVACAVLPRGKGGRADV